MTPGEKYRHFKGGKYEVLMLAFNTDHNYTDVVYKNNANEVFTRNYDTWFDEVMPNITRFKKIEEKV
jgi:hypothetical protein